MLYDLSLAGVGGKEEKWSYDSTLNTLYDNDKTPVRVVPFEKYYGVLGENRSSFSSIRLILGAGCNYHCQYCAQSPMKGMKIADKAFDAEKYARQLRKFYDSHCRSVHHIKFSVWGGEPLLYLDRFKALHSELLEAFEGHTCSFYFMTNGSLLKGEAARYLLDNNFWLSLSHDGPGQKMRNPNEDVLSKGTETREVFLEGMNHHGWSVAGVMHRYNSSLREYILYMTNLLDTSHWRLADAVNIRIGDECAMKVAYTEEQYVKELSDRTMLLLEAEDDPFLTSILGPSFIHKRLYRFTQWLGKTEVPVSDCIIADNDRYLYLDMKGNSWGCQNAVGVYSSEHGKNLWGGNILTEEYRHIDHEKIHLEDMSKCKNCLLRAMCAGGCRLLPQKYDLVNCRHNYLMYYPLFVRAMKNISGMTLVNVLPHLR